MKAAIASLAFLLSAVGLTQASPPVSGLQPGDEVSAWEPIHIAGPHAGTKTCPVCTYLEAPVLLAFARDTSAAALLAKPLEAIAAAHARGKLKVVLVVDSGSDDELRAFAKVHPSEKLMLCRPDPERWEKQLKAYKIDPAVANTVMLYRDYKVVKSWTGMTPANAAELAKATDPYLPKR